MSCIIIVNYIFLARDQTRVKVPPRIPSPVDPVRNCHFRGFFSFLSFFFWYGGNDIPWLEDVCSGISS